MSKQNELAQLADAVTVDGSSVGIGTSSPSAKLDVNGGTTYPAFKTSRDGGSAASQGYTTFGHSAVGYSGGTGADTYIVSEHGYGFAVNGGTTALAITDTGNVSIGTSSPLSLLDVTLEATGQRRFLVNYDDSAITIKGSNGSSNPESLRVVASTFKVNTGTSGSGTERMRIDNDGLKFNGDTAAANALNDYEEGTFTPVVEAYAGTDPTVGYTSRSGSYTKIGNLVFVNIIIALSSYSGGTSNILMISGFPFPIGPSATGTLNSRYTNFVRTTSHSAPVQKLTDYGVGFLTCNNNTNWAWEYTNILQASSSMNITYQYETTA